MPRPLRARRRGGNVSLYNDSASGPIPPTPTLAMVGAKDGYDAPPMQFTGTGTILVVGDRVLAGDQPVLGGSEYLAQFGGSDAFPTLPADAPAVVEALASVANETATLAVHDVSHGGLAVTLAEMVSAEAGGEVTLSGDASAAALAFHEQVGRAVVETTEPDAVRDAFDGVAPVHEVGQTNGSGDLTLDVNGETLRYDAATVQELRGVIDRELD